MRCTSFWGHDWVVLKDSQPWYEYTWKQICKNCGLVQKMEECVGEGDFIYVDVGYAENKNEVIAFWSNLKAEQEQSTSHVKHDRDRMIRENIIPTSKLILSLTNKEVDSC